MTAPTLPEYREAVAELRRRAERYRECAAVESRAGILGDALAFFRRADALKAAADSLERQAAGF